MLIDTHCHIHEANYPLDLADTLRRAHEAGINQMICVGTSEESSREAVQCAQHHEHVYASVGVHPHDTKDGYGEISNLLRKFAGPAGRSAPTLARPAGLDSVGAAPPPVTRASDLTKLIVAVGEIGLDYFYTHSPRAMQIEALEYQIQLALDHNLPIIFHVREAFEDFWPIFDNFPNVRGELHSFTDSMANLEAALTRGLLIGVNGISTFTKDDAQKAMFASIPADSLLLETDAPFLTPVPFRGKVNEPAFVRQIAEYHASIRNVSFKEIATVTSRNATRLFAL